MYSLNSWPKAGISVCATIVSLQTEQCLPAVLPAAVQVAAMASSVTSVWPLAATVSELYAYSQTEQVCVV